MAILQNLLDLPPSTILLIALGFFLVGFYLYFSTQSDSQSSFPLINAHPNDHTRALARRQFLSDALSLLRTGIETFPDRPFKIITALSERIILPHSWIDFVKKCPDLDHQEQVAAEFFGAYPGFEGIKVFNDPKQVLIKLVTKKMSSISKEVLAKFEHEVDLILADQLLATSGNPEWKEIDFNRLCTRFIADLSSLIFVGPRLSRRKDWFDLTQSYTTNLFHAARVLRSWPAILRPVVHWFLPECSVLRRQIAQARHILASQTIGADEENTVLAWLRDEQVDMAAIQLGLAAGGFHTTTQLLSQVLLDLAVSFDAKKTLIDELRDEWDDARRSTDDRVQASTLPKLNLLDACIKESQRLKPQVMVNLERMAVKDVVLPNGQVVRRGTQIAVPTLCMFDGTTNAGFDPYRWTRDGAVTSNKLVNSSDAHFAFGMGKFICPGRFLVAAEIKMAVAKLLEKWDIRIQKGQEDKIRDGRVMWRGVGFEMLTEWDVAVEVRRHQKS